MPRFVMLVLMALPGCFAQAQYAGYQPLADATVFRTGFAAAAAQTNSFASHFVQEKNLSLLSEKMVSTGKFWFKKEAMVRMEYEQPFQYLMILNNGDVYVRDGQKENRVNAKSNKLLRQINDIMIDCLRGTVLKNPNFAIKIFEGKQSFMVEGVPLDKTLRVYFKTILITADKKDYSVSSINMIEQSGDNTIIRFTNKEINAVIPDSEFAVH